MNRPHITFRQLELFREVVREGSISRAAQRLHLTQPTISSQLRKLADQLGCELLDFRGAAKGHRPGFTAARGGGGHA